MSIFFKPHFAKVDTALRRGSHITPGDFASHEFIAQNFDAMQEFYETYQCTLTEHPDGFFFLMTEDSIIPSRFLSKPCVHLGQLLALMARDPAITKTRGVVSIDKIFQTLSTMFSADLLNKIYAPKTREIGTEKQIKKEVQKALRTLSQLNFVILENGGEAIRMTEAINRFADVARHNNEPTNIIQRDLEIKRGIHFDAFEANDFEGEESNDED